MTEKIRTRVLVGSICIFLLFCATGCANRVEINDRSMVLSVAIDKPKAGEDAEATEQQGQDGENSQQGEGAGGGGKEEPVMASEDFYRVPPPPVDQRPRYAMTIEAPLLAQGGGSTGEDGQQEQSLVVTGTGNTLWEIERSLGLRLGRENFYGHLVAVVISDEIAREGIQPVLDFFSRRREVQQNLQVVISNGEARKVLQVVPKEEQFSGLYLIELLTVDYRTGAKANTSLLEVRRSLVSTGNAVLPRVRAASPNEVTVGGAAVIKDWKLKGWLSELETSGYNLVTNELPGGSLTIVDPKDKSNLITSILRSSAPKKSVKLEDGQPVYKIKLISEWDIVEKGSAGSLGDSSYLIQIEKRIEAELQRRALAVIDKMQREFKTDIFNFGSMLHQKYPRYWERVEKQWDDKYFSKAKVVVESSVKIRRTESKT